MCLCACVSGVVVSEVGRAEACSRNSFSFQRRALFGRVLIQVSKEEVRKMKICMHTHTHKHTKQHRTSEDAASEH